MRVVLVEDLEGILRLAVPQPGVFSRGVEDFADVVLGALDGTSQPENNLNDFLVLGNPVVEGLTFILRLVLLVPVLNLLGRFQNVRGSTLDGRLNLLGVRLEGAVSFNKLASVSATCTRDGTAPASGVHTKDGSVFIGTCNSSKRQSEPVRQCHQEILKARSNSG